MRRGLILFARAKQELIRIDNATFFREHPAADSDTATNPPLFPQLNYSLSAPTLEAQKEYGGQRKHEHWAVIAANDGTTFLEVLRGSHFCLPPNARTYPYLSSAYVAEKDKRLRIPSRAIQYVGFNPGKGKSLGAGVQGAYLSARYESYREETDWSVLQYLRDETELNALETEHLVDEKLLRKVVNDLKLQKLLDMPVSNLSNGQTRRARIAKALLGKPELLCLDEPFMGLDPPTLVKLSPILRGLAYKESPLLMLALRPQDPIPDWITHLAILGQNHTVPLLGPRADVMYAHHRWKDLHHNSKRSDKASRARDTAIEMTRLCGPPLQGLEETLTDSGVVAYDAYSKFLKAATSQHFEAEGSTQERSPALTIAPKLFREIHDQTLASAKSSRHSDQQHSSHNEPRRELGEPIIELKSVVVKYGEKVVLGGGAPGSESSSQGLNLNINRGTRLALLGPNGSGKTTMLSLLTSDHPQSYSLPIKFFGRTRLPEPGKPGLSLWEIQSRIGHTAPEIHAFFPKRLTVRQVLESAWAETFISRPKLSSERSELVDSFLRWWEPELRQDKAPSMTDTYENPDWLPAESGEFVQSCYPPLTGLIKLWWEKNHGTSSFDSVRTGSVDWAKDRERHAFGVLPFGTQRLLLLLRAMIKQPDILILDEAFSGLSVEIRDKAMCFLEHGETKFLQVAAGNRSADKSRLADNHRLELEQVLMSLEAEDSAEMADTAKQLFSSKELLFAKARAAKQDVKQGGFAEYPQIVTYHFTGLTDQQALVVVSHVKEEVPAVCDQWLRLPGEEEIQEEGRGIEMGWVDRGALGEEWWRIWGSTS